MARIRTIKPEFFTSEDITDLSSMARLLYIALWCEADREGRMVWKPKTFKLRSFPADSCDIERLCQELLAQGLIVLYGDGLAYIPAFSDHQHINPRESVSTLPAPDASPRVRTRQARDSDAQVGKERKGKEGVDDASVDDALFAGIPSEVVRDFKALRAKKKAPITETAMRGIRREAEKAGLTLESALRICCERGWTGFNSEWAGAKPSASAAPAKSRPLL
jgi:hypothetical protein